MTDEQGRYPPDDEPVIGAPASPPGRQSQPEPVIGASYPPAEPEIGAGASRFPASPVDEPPHSGYEEDDDTGPYEDDYEYDEEYEYEPEYDDGYYYEGYGPPPGRQPMFYVLVALAVVLVGIFIYLLFVLFQNDEQGEPRPISQAAVVIDSPLNETRIDVGVEREVRARATSTDEIQSFQLFVDGRMVDERPPAGPAARNEYPGSLLVRLDRVGTYELVVRVVTSLGATADSDPVTVYAVEPLDAPPDAITGTVVAKANLRTGPGESFGSAGSLDPGDQVTIVGKTRDVEWLLVDIGGAQLWIKRQAVQVDDSLSLVPVREPTPTPVPDPTETPEPSSSPSPSPDPNAPDFLPADAVIEIVGANEQRLFVTIANGSSAPYEGVLVVAVDGLPSGSAEFAFPVNIPGNGSTTVNFPLSQPVTSDINVTVEIDPDNAVNESNEDNNITTFVVTAPADAPIVSLSASVNANIGVTISNTGGPLNVTNASIRVTTNAASLTTSLGTLSLATGASQSINVLRPPANGGTYTVELLTGTQVLASIEVPVPTETATPEPTTTE